MSIRARVRAGDADAFAWLFDEFARGVYNHAFRLTGNWSTAEDVVALTFLEAWRLRAKVDVEGGSLRPRLLGIAINVVRNTARAARRHGAAVARLPPPVAVPDFADEVAARIDDARVVEVVREALAGLRRTEREVFALCVGRPGLSGGGGVVGHSGGHRAVPVGAGPKEAGSVAW